ncbi:MAG TPA: hypothetical protein VGJ94_12470 [Syntrophorhabdaceae bacterium]|jgi:hypothetical protein
MFNPKGIGALVPSLIFISGFFSFAFGGQCYVGKASFAVVQPYLIERVCYLYSHESRTYKPGMESGNVVALPSVDLHPDQLHVEYLKLLGEKKFRVLERRTPVFNCGYDLELIKRSPDEALMKSGPLPEFNCSGYIYRMVPLRLVNENTCYWAAEAVVRCEEQVPLPDTPFTLFEDELRGPGASSQ